VSRRVASFRLGMLFALTPGAFHARSELEPGTVPLISCGEENNGVIGYFDIPEESTHERALTVAFNGFPLTTNFHPYRFGAKDDVAVLTARDAMSDGVLIYIAALLNRMRWRYSYGRKCYREKLENVSIVLPTTSEGKIDASVADEFLEAARRQVKTATERSLAALFKKSTR
jgi:type I restriction enzyme M protein